MQSQLQAADAVTWLSSHGSKFKEVNFSGLLAGLFISPPFLSHPLLVQQPEYLSKNINDILSSTLLAENSFKIQGRIIPMAYKEAQGKAFADLSTLSTD